MSKITEIRYVGYGVKDLALERAFYGDPWGLKEVAEHDGMVYFAAQGSDEPFVVRLRQADAPRIDVIALAADSRPEVDELYERIQAHGCQMIFSPQPLAGFGGGYGFRFFSKDGLSFEISCDVVRGSSRELRRWEGVPHSISHIVLHSPDHHATVAFFTDVLGFKVSDWLGDFMAFLRCNEWHHRIGIMPGPPSLNHVAYDMPSIDEMMKGMSRLKQRGIDVRWGPGRHTAGNNTFSYFTTPGGFAVEYTSELDRVGEDWQTSVHTPSPQVIDQWGIGVGGPHTMPHPRADTGLFDAVDR
jgi:catechol 2,3-dioxygenase-like lactoylglutathione lyase family enzyme